LRPARRTDGRCGSGSHALRLKRGVHRAVERTGDLLRGRALLLEDALGGVDDPLVARTLRDALSNS